MNNLTKKEIIQYIYQNNTKCRNGEILQSDIKDIVQCTIDVFTKSLAQGKSVELRNFGVLEVQVRKSRIGRNPTMPENDVIIPKRAVVKFKAGKELKNALKSVDLANIEEIKQSKTRK